ncbi:PTS sugar transporter subunit IIA [Caldalkalibacillus salinus]|uniref:PTS sugar transporter subunit IIA n=1 Tax=Caldalkalibacillus salinus TaxID=2803787 RepID=UPI00192366BA|nr:PTS glucose transporter subunit IIA [Caldalkalibacillus salinus]
MFEKLMNKIVGGKPEQETFVSPLTGTIVSLSEVPDPTFSQKMMGDGVAIMPSEGEVVSPVEGKIVQIFPTKHAIGIESKAGIEILIHIGIETVAMNGEGFKSFVKEGDKVKAGDRLIRFDLELVKEKANDTVTPVLITNGDQVESMETMSVVQTSKGETNILKIKAKK